MLISRMPFHFQPKINRAGRVRCEPGWRLDWSDPGFLTDFDLWFVWAGFGRMKLRAGEAALRPGVCLWMRPGGVYVAQQDLRNRLGVTFIHFDLRPPPRAGAGIPPEVHEVRDFVFFDAVSRRIV